eukprot:4131422-Prorocentrum_lima.AAC.1
MTNGSRAKRWAMWLAMTSSRPLARSRSLASSSTAHSTSLYFSTACLERMAPCAMGQHGLALVGLQ